MFPQHPQIRPLTGTVTGVVVIDARDPHTVSDTAATGHLHQLPAGATAELEVGTTWPIDHAPRLADFAREAVARGVNLTVRGSADALAAWCWLLSPRGAEPPHPPAVLTLVPPTTPGGDAS